MTSQDAELQKKRIAEYDRLSAAKQRIQKAIAQFTADDPNGPCGQGPFTGNTRESRRVEYLRIFFTKTRGGADAVEMTTESLNIEAFEFAGMLVTVLRAQLAYINEFIEKV